MKDFEFDFVLVDSSLVDIAEGKESKSDAAVRRIRVGKVVGGQNAIGDRDVRLSGFKSDVELSDSVVSGCASFRRDFNIDGSPYRLNIKTQKGTLSKGQQILIINYIEEGGYYIVEPYETID